MKNNIYSQIRGSTQPNISDGEKHFTQMNNRGNTLISNSQPSSSHLSSLGGLFHMILTTAATPVTSIPTTTYALAIQNYEPENGKSYIIDSVFAWTSVLTAAQQSAMILVNVSQQNLTTLAAGTVITPRSASGRTYSGCAKGSAATTMNATDGVAANWFPLGTTANICGAASTFSTCTEYDCRGMFVIPPKNIFAIAPFATTATATSVILGIRWYEVILPPRV